MNKVVVITGTTSGIGLELKNRYLKDKDIVVEINKEGEFDNITKFYADLADEQLIRNAFSEIEKIYDHIDVLINCAGFPVFGATELVDLEKAKNIFIIFVR